MNYDWDKEIKMKEYHIESNMTKMETWITENVFLLWAWHMHILSSKNKKDIKREKQTIAWVDENNSISDAFLNRMQKKQKEKRM